MSVSAKGKVIEVYPYSAGCYVRLGAGAQPKNGFFHLNLSHKNYNSLYSLVLAAAINRYQLTIRTEAEINSNEKAEVLYMTIRWD